MLRALLRRMQTGDEGETGFDGFLSHAGEWHMLAVGLIIGGFSALTTPYIAVLFILAAMGLIPVAAGYEAAGVTPPKTLRELRSEPHYLIGGVGLGYPLTTTLSALSPALIVFF